MALLSWSPQYLIGNPQIDAEHEELFRLINAFHDSWLDARQPDNIARVLNRLVAYAQSHFRHEEEIMATTGFPKLEGHQRIHETMVETIFTLQQSLEDKSLRLEMETMKFLKAWLIEHILENDYLFRDFLARQKRKDETQTTTE